MAFAYPVSSEDEAQALIKTLRSEYHDARHWCYAYRLGPEPLTERSSDDGEPANSAGKPILNQLKVHQLINVLIVVVRYFGGTLLGVGGLIQAYRNATADAISKATIIHQTIQKKFTIHFPYTALNVVFATLKTNNAIIYDKQIGSLCYARFSIDLPAAEQLINKLIIIGKNINISPDETQI